MWSVMRPLILPLVFRLAKKYRPGVYAAHDFPHIHTVDQLHNTDIVQSFSDI